MDICGLFLTELFRRKRYFISFIDDYTCHAWIYLMRKKSEAPDCFKSFLLSLPADVKVQVLQSDHVGEYTSSAFRAFLQKNGIELSASPAYTPKYNGVAECLNQTIMEMVRAMLFNTQLMKGFWGEAMAQAMYINNHLPT
jgi:transposase InsO family protein